MVNRFMQIKVPAVKYQEAKRYQQSLMNNNGLSLPLWACMLENEKRNMHNKQNNDINKMFRRLI